MPALDSYLVSIGVKGQEAVLSTMKQIRKEGANLSKGKTAVSLAEKTATKTKSKTPIEKPVKAPASNAASLAKATAGTVQQITAKAIKAPPSVSPSQAPANTDPLKKFTDTENKKTKTDKNDTEKKEKTNKEFSDSAKKFGNGVKDFAATAATLDPTATIQGFSSALGTSLSGISVLGVSLGRLPEGIAALTNTTLSMAKNSVDMAKQSTLAYHQLSDRNAATKQYGGAVHKGNMSNAEQAGFVGAVSGSMGIIQKPLGDTINNLINKKDTGALANVAAGNWESTGTDKGWILQQITNGMQGMPPSVKQSLNASLMASNSDIIQDSTADQRGAQRNAAAFSDRGEAQTTKLYGASLNGSGQTRQTITDMENGLNSLQATLMETGLQFSNAITSTISTIQAMPESIKKMKKAMDDFSRDSSGSNLSNLTNTVLRLIP